MIFHEFGNETLPVVMLIHGGGNAWWNYLRQARALAAQYHVIVPTLDGHGEAAETPYVSTEKTAEDLLAYIDAHCGGHVFALCGVSLGGQIVIEMLTRRANVAEKAIIDGSLCMPKPFMAWCCRQSVRFFGALLFSERACRLQLALMPRLLPKEMCYPEEIKTYYLRDMPRTPRATLLAMYKTYMARYRLGEGLRYNRAEVQYWYGEKEMACVKQSARRFQRMHPNCETVEIKGAGHGYLAVYLPEQWLARAAEFFERA